MTRIRDKGAFRDIAPRREPMTESAASTSTRLRQLGIDAADPIGPSNVGASKIIDVVGKERFAKIDAVRVPGRVAWLNYDLARELGFDVPPSGRLTGAAERSVLDALAWRIPGPDEDVGDRETLRVFADRYGGTGLGVAQGSGRTAFLPYGNLSIKGIGKTPLSPEHDSDFLHSHGGAPMREGFVEAIWGEVNANLFTEGSTRILAVIDTGDFTEFPDGTKERRALIVRAGSQLRPAHLLADRDSGHKTTPVIFARAAKESGHLVTREVNGKTVMDFGATLDSLIDAHAKTAAEQVRWRVLHGAVSSSNMEIDGGQLDLATQTSQPHTAPIHILRGTAPFLSEHQERVAELQRMASAVFSGFSKAERSLFAAKKPQVSRPFMERYAEHLDLQLAKAAGLKTEVAERLPRSVVEPFARVVRDLAALTNVDGRFNADKEVHRDKSAVDVFNVLRRLPGIYFADPQGDHSAAIRDLLRTKIDGNPRAAGQLANKIDALVAELGPAYAALMEAARNDPAYDDADAMVRSVGQRAAFENMPLDRLYKAELHQGLIEQIDAYAWHNDPSIFREAIDKTVSASLRSVDALIGQGTARRLDDGGLELGRRTIDGIDYAVRAWDGGRRRLHLEMPVGNDGVLTTLPGAPRLSNAQLDNLVYRFTTDGWRTTQEVEAKRDGDTVTFDIPVLGSDVGQLEGVFYADAGAFWLKDGASNFRGYSFAVPDRAELAQVEDAFSSRG
ncbi:MAG: hypothetical protein RIT81_18250 [Deltaproteobacteria bacterium]